MTRLGNKLVNCSTWALMGLSVIFGTNGLNWATTYSLQRRQIGVVHRVEVILHNVPEKKGKTENFCIYIY